MSVNKLFLLQPSLFGLFAFCLMSLSKFLVANKKNLFSLSRWFRQTDSVSEQWLGSSESLGGSEDQAWSLSRTRTGPGGETAPVLRTGKDWCWNPRHGHPCVQNPGTSHTSLDSFLVSLTWLSSGRSLSQMPPTELQERVLCWGGWC